jgi:murein L,D-transpeptidase YafK
VPLVRARFVLLAAAIVLASPPTRAIPLGAAGTAAAPGITRVSIRKNAHTLTLFAGDQPFKTYAAAIGPGGSGPKRKEGDMVTPVGRYHVTMRQPSQYRVFLRLDYPNAHDRARFNEAKAAGALPKNARIGGDIGIHGPPVRLPAEIKSKIKDVDWTAGCIAVDEDEIDEISKLVPDGVVVDIED